MKVIYKYNLNLGHNNIFLPLYSKIISADFQNGQLVIWVLQSMQYTSQETTAIKVVTTGESFSDTNMQYLTTCSPDNNQFVVHVFAEVKGGAK
jgi:hypothetical protein